MPWDSVDPPRRGILSSAPKGDETLGLVSSPAPPGARSLRGGHNPSHHAATARPEPTARPADRHPRPGRRPAAGGGTKHVLILLAACGGADKGSGGDANGGDANGTTSMIDYAVWAPGEGLPEPVALGFMTGGDYTENQTPMEDVAALGTPAVFTYSTAEAAWSIEQQGLDPGVWEFFDYTGGDHGTLMFDAAPEVADDLDGFLAGVLD